MHETIIVNELYRKIDNIVDRELYNKLNTEINNALYGELFHVLHSELISKSIRINQNLNGQIKWR